jgi:hypothetical protein
MGVRADNGVMIAFGIIITLIVIGLVSHLRSASGDLADRDRRGWWPGAAR